MLISFGVADVADCFHHMLLPECLKDYFCWPPVPAGSVGISAIGGQPVSAGTMIWPRNCALPMGFSWAPFRAQQANLHQFSQSLQPAQSHLLTDKGGVWVLQPGQQSKAHYVYIDNLGCLCENHSYVREAIASATSHFGRVGLDLHEVDVSPDGGQHWACILTALAG